MMELRYFKLSEFDSPDVPGTGERMREEFLAILDEIRGRVGFPMRITSGYRTPEHNKSVGGKENSLHLFGQAADIYVADGRQAADIVFAAMARGLRVGVKRVSGESGFVHLDMGRGAPMMWTY